MSTSPSPSISSSKGPARDGNANPRRRDDQNQKVSFPDQSTIKFSTQIGPGRSWLLFISGLIEACRTAGFHVVANSLATGTKPKFKEAEVDEIQTNLSILVAQVRDLEYREKKIINEPPWTPANLTRLQNEYRDTLMGHLASSRLHLPIEVQGLFDLQISELMLYFREPSMIIRNIYEQLQQMCAEHGVVIPDYINHAVSAWFQKAGVLRDQALKMQLDIDLSRARLSAALQNHEREKTEYMRQCCAVLTHLQQSNLYSDAAFRDRMKHDPLVLEYVREGDLLAYISYVKNVYDPTVSPTVLSDKLLEWQFMVPKAKERFNAFYDRWTVDKDACIAAGCSMPPNDIQVSSMINRILIPFYQDGTVKSFLSQLRLPPSDPLHRALPGTVEELVSTLMSVIQSGSTSKKLPDLSYVMPSSSAQDASKPTGKSSNSSVDYVAAMSDAKPTSQPPLQGNRRRRGGRGRGQNNSQRSQSPVAHGNSPLLASPMLVSQARFAPSRLSLLIRLRLVRRLRAFSVVFVVVIIW